MKLEDFENAWAAQTIGGPALDPADVTRQLEQEIRGAVRRFVGMIVMAAGLLFLGWTVALGAHLTGIKPLTLLETTAHVVGSVFYLGWLALAVRSWRAVQCERRAAGGTVREASAVSLRVVELQLSNYRIAGWTLPLAVALSGLLSWAKYSHGELHGWGAWIATGFLALLAAIAGAAIAHRRRTELHPRRLALRRLHENLSVPVNDAG